MRVKGYKLYQRISKDTTDIKGYKGYQRIQRISKDTKDIKEHKGRKLSKVDTIVTRDQGVQDQREINSQDIDTI